MYPKIHHLLDSNPPHLKGWRLWDIDMKDTVLQGSVDVGHVDTLCELECALE
jgi:hypothetical protein